MLTKTKNIHKISPFFSKMPKKVHAYSPGEATTKNLKEIRVLCSDIIATRTDRRTDGQTTDKFDFKSSAGIV